MLADSEYKATVKDLVSNCRRAKWKKDSNSKVDIYIFIQNELNTIVSSLLDPQQISGVLGCDQCYISRLVQAKSTSVSNLPADAPFKRLAANNFLKKRNPVAGQFLLSIDEIAFDPFV